MCLARDHGYCFVGSWVTVINIHRHAMLWILLLLLVLLCPCSRGIQIPHIREHLLLSDIVM